MIKRLLFDIGNTRVKWALGYGDDLSDQGALVHCTADDDFFNGIVRPDIRPDEVWVASVGPTELLDKLSGWSVMQFGLEPGVVSVLPKACGIQNNYLDLQSLGVDRWVAALGARRLQRQGNVIIVDAGTAVTIDLLSAQNSFEGGVILPGARMMHDALVGRTAGIASEISSTVDLIGKTTRDCVNSGVKFGMVGAVERVILEMWSELEANVSGSGAVASLMLTGGDASLVAAHSRLDFNQQDDLVLHGLAQLAAADV